MLPPTRNRGLEVMVMTASGVSLSDCGDVPDGLDRNGEPRTFAGREPRLRNWTARRGSPSRPRIKHNVARPSSPKGPPRGDIGAPRTPQAVWGVRDRIGWQWKGGQRR
jgi:hypothetical protein